MGSERREQNGRPTIGTLINADLRAQSSICERAAVVNRSIGVYQQISVPCSSVVVSLAISANSAVTFVRRSAKFAEPTRCRNRVTS